MQCVSSFVLLTTRPSRNAPHDLAIADWKDISPDRKPTVYTLCTPSLSSFHNERVHSGAAEALQVNSVRYVAMVYENAIVRPTQSISESPGKFGAKPRRAPDRPTVQMTIPSGGKHGSQSDKCRRES